MPSGISKNPLNDISQVYLDSISEGRLASLEKASVLSASDDPKDQDKAREIKTRFDYESLKKQIGSKKKHSKPVVGEGLSDWRDDLREITGGASPMLSSNPVVGSEPSTNIHGTDDQTGRKVVEKKIKNKIKINPTFKEAAEEIAENLGGKLLEVAEVMDDKKDEEDRGLKSKQQKARMIKKQVLMKKLQAVRQGSEDIVAHYEPEGEEVDEACWKGYKAYGMKKKGGKMVPNCKPVGSVKEAKVDKGRSDYGKASIRNYRSKGPGYGEPAMFDSENKRGKLIDKRREEHKARRGVKGAKVPAYKVEGYQRDPEKLKKDKTRSKQPDPSKDGFTGIGNMSIDDIMKMNKKMKKEEVVVVEADKKGKGSGSKDACYHKVKASAKVWPSAYASGRLVQCRKKGASNYGKSKSESYSWRDEFEFEDVTEAKDVTAVAKELDKASKMHKGQADKLRKHAEDMKEAKSAAWQRKEGKRESGGLNQKGVDSYRAANPGSKLKTAVTTKPSKLKKGSKSANRRKSFCARMGGMKKRLTSAKTARDPDSRINKALRKWNCSYELTGTSIMEKDSALDFVKKQIEKKHGKGAIYDGKSKSKSSSPEEKAKASAERKKRQDADNKAYASRAKKAGYKSTQDYTNVVARYGSEDNYRKGKGLGT